MDELVPNPDGCRAFEPNQFKKEKCKNCGRQWQEHKGVITEALVNSYAGAKRKATEDKLQKEAEAKAKLKAKAVAKKKSQQAVEDEWLFDSKEGDKAPVTSAIDSDDDDMGFRMFSAQDLAQAPVESRVARTSESFKPLKVKNLIDFGECDVPEDLGSSMPSVPSQEIGPAPSKLPTSLPSPGPSPNSSSSAVPMNNAGLFGTEDHNGVMADLLAEMDNLKLMLQNANEEKNIQVAIVKDEVAEKQQVIEDMKLKSAAAQAELVILRDRLKDEGNIQQQTGETDALRQQVADRDADIDRLKAELGSLRDRLKDEDKTQQQTVETDALRQQVADRDAEIDRLKAAALLPLPQPVAADPAKEEELARLRLEVEELRKSKATLEQKLSDAEVAASSAISAAALAATKTPPVATETSRQSVVSTTELPQEAASQVVHRQAALALREVRLNAERQLAWISKRIKTSYQDGRDNAISCP